MKNFKMQPIKEKLEHTIKFWDRIKISVKDEGKWQEIPLSEVKNQEEIAKYIMLIMSPYLK